MAPEARGAAGAALAEVAALGEGVPAAPRVLAPALVAGEAACACVVSRPSEAPLAAPPRAAGVFEIVAGSIALSVARTGAAFVEVAAAPREVTPLLAPTCAGATPRFDVFCDIAAAPAAGCERVAAPRGLAAELALPIAGFRGACELAPLLVFVLLVFEAAGCEAARDGVFGAAPLFAGEVSRALVGAPEVFAGAAFAGAALEFEEVLPASAEVCGALSSGGKYGGRSRRAPLCACAANEKEISSIAASTRGKTKRGKVRLGVIKNSSLKMLRRLPDVARKKRRPKIFAIVSAPLLMTSEPTGLHRVAKQSFGKCFDSDKSSFVFRVPLALWYGAVFHKREYSRGKSLMNFSRSARTR